MFKIILFIFSVHFFVFAQTPLKMKLSDIRPTQAVVGMIEVEDKINELKKKSPTDLDQYLQEKIAPVVVGFNRQHCIIDRHH